MDLSPAKEDSDTDSVKGESQAPAALPPAAGLTPDQLRKAGRHRRKYGLALPRPNSPKPKKLSPQKNSEHLTPDTTVLYACLLTHLKLECSGDQLRAKHCVCVS